VSTLGGAARTGFHRGEGKDVSDRSRANRADDDKDLAAFGYRQELHRSLGSFSTFAAGFSYISVLTGGFQLFFFAFAMAGPAFVWTWPVVVFGQLLFALCFAELAAHYPVAGSIYSWAKQVARPATAWLAGWMMLVTYTVTIAAVALAWQIILPAISPTFQIIGDGTGKYDFAENAVLLGTILIVIVTTINCLGVRITALINNVGVITELLAVVLLTVLLAAHITRGPGVFLETHGTSAGHTLGYGGALLVAMLFANYVLWGFETAGSVSEETNDPRRTSPKSIIRALAAAGVAGGVLVLVALMAVGDINAKELSVSGLPFIVKDTLGSFLGDVFLWAVVVSITVCCLAVQAGTIRLIFAMARDNALPGGRVLARVSERSKTPIVPAIVTGAIAIAILLINIKQPQIFLVVTSLPVVMAMIAYVLVCGPLLLRRLRGSWKQEPGYFSLGKFGTIVNAGAVAWGIAVAVNIAWPRNEIYNPADPHHWYLQWAGVVGVGAVIVIGLAWYALVQRHRIGVLAEHRASAEPVTATEPPLLGEVDPVPS
jgi:urea carboxylase system permease